VRIREHSAWALMSYRSQLYPASVKGVVIRDERVLLLRNEREEWELPGGKLELGEDPAKCVGQTESMSPRQARAAGRHGLVIRPHEPRGRGQRSELVRDSHVPGVVSILSAGRKDHATNQ
jgi:hypothetical protein